MGNPFEKTMETINELAKPGLKFIEASDSEFAPLSAALLRSRVEHFEDLASMNLSPGLASSFIVSIVFSKGFPMAYPFL